MKRRFLFRYLHRLGVNPFFCFKFKHFKRRKWKKYQFFLLPRLPRFVRSRFSRPRFPRSRFRFPPYDKIALRKYGFERLTKAYRSCLFFKRHLSLVYGNLRHKTLSNQASFLTKQSHKNLNLRLLLVLESRLDIILVRSNFAVTIQQAQAWIRRGLIQVNGVIVTSINFYLQFGDSFCIDVSLMRVVARWVRRWKKNRILFCPFYNIEILPRVLSGVFLGYDRQKIHQHFNLSRKKVSFLHKMLANYYFINFEHDKLNVFFR